MKQQVMVGVACMNAEGAPDVFFADVFCSPEGIEEGRHYNQAKFEATEAGYEGPMVAFDESDPLWAMMAKRVDAPYREVVQVAVQKFQDFYLGDREINGADLVDSMGDFLRTDLVDAAARAGGSPICWAVYHRYGFLRAATVDAVNDEVVDEFSLVTSPDVVKAAVDAGAVAVDLTRLLVDSMGSINLPGADELKAAAEAALDRAEEYGFNPGSNDRAVEVMREEFALDGVYDDIPPEFNPILVRALRDEGESRAQMRPAQGDAPRG